MAAFVVAPSNRLHAQGGKVVDVVVHAASLERNLVGDSANRHVLVYLPPSYTAATRKRYPTVYLLHGFQGSYNQWRPILGVMNQLIAARTIREMILVMPDGNNRFGGSFYTNSATTGNWEDFVTKDLIRFVDGHYRSIPAAASRGIAGHSMGGYGAIKLAMKHPDVYGAVYAMSACCLGWGGDLSAENVAWDTTLAFTSMKDLSPRDEIYFAQALMGLSAAWSPNPASPPFYADLLVRRNGAQRAVIESSRARWSANMPVALVDQYRSNLSQLRGIAFDVGRQDQFTHIPIASRELSKALTRNGIKHAFSEYEGDHNNHVPDRLVTMLLPFFARTLSFEN